MHHQQKQQMDAYQSNKLHMEMFNGNNMNDEMSQINNAKIAIGNCESGDLMSDLMLLKGDKESVQFLQNVHFPEKVYSFKHHRTSNNTGVLAHLLPPNMTFYDILMEPREFQYNWFLRLIETYGLEEAGKFTEMIKQAPPLAFSNNCIKMNNSDGNTGLFNTLSESVGKINLQPQQPNFGQNEEFDNIFAMSINQPIYKNTLEGGKEDFLDTNMHQMKQLLQLQQSQQQMAGINVNFANERNILNGIDLFNFPRAYDTTAYQVQNRHEDPTAAQQFNSQRSVPLYKRQAAHKNESSSNGSMF